MRAEDDPDISRRQWLKTATATAVLSGSLVKNHGHCSSLVDEAADHKALIAITLDLEMVMHYPQWGMTEWNFEKGNLTDPVKQYALEVCRRVKAKGGIVQCFVVGRVFEQPDVEWIRQIVQEGHAVGNHTYDHVNLWAKKPEELQYRFSRCPWLIRNKSIPEVIRENIRLTEWAMQARLGVTPIGFRTPGGSPEGLQGRLDLQQLLLDCGCSWVSSMAPHVAVQPENPTEVDFTAIVRAQATSQPFVYPSGLIEIPMSPHGDVASFRRKDKKWKLRDFLTMVEKNIRWAIDNRAVYDLLTHPGLMLYEDPHMETYDLVCDLVHQSGGNAILVDLQTIAERVQASLPQRDRGSNG